MRRLATIAVIAVSTILTACGGSDPEGEIADVTNRIGTAETAKEIEVACSELLSPAFLDEVYGGKLEKCLEKPVNNEGDEEADLGVPEVESVEVDGSTAKAKIVTEGGEIAGSGGTWTFTEGEDGWQLDRIEDDYLRSTFGKTIEIVDGGAFAFEPVRECMGRQIDALDSAALRELSFENLRGDRERFLGAILDLSEKCPDAMNAYVADQIATGVVAERGATPAQVECARRELVPLLELTGLTKQSMEASINPTDAKESVVGAALAGLVSGAMKRCPR